MPKFIDLTGMKFNRLTVIRRADNHITPSGKSVVMWECECECGNKIITSGELLRSEQSKSCGCLQKEIIRKIGKQFTKNNKYDLSGSFGIGYTNNGKKFLFDLEDYDKIKDYCWNENGNGFIMAREKETRKTIKLSRLIMNFPKDMDVNYMNHDALDNRKQNLKIVSHMVSTWGTNIYKNNTSGTTGVYFNKQHQKWEAYIKINKKKIYLGIYKDKQDAIKARKIAEEKYFGEYSYDNRMKGDEDNE